MQASKEEFKPTAYKGVTYLPIKNGYQLFHITYEDPMTNTVRRLNVGSSRYGMTDDRALEIRNSIIKKLQSGKDLRIHKRNVKNANQ